MPDITTDLVVLGGGPGGYAGAFLAADRGIQTVLVDAEPKPGGTCLHRGCIPSKTLLHAAHVIHAAHDAEQFGIKFGKPEINIDVLRAKGLKVVDMMASHLLELCKKRGIPLVNRKAVLADANTLLVDDGSKIRFQRLMIATGSLPAKLPSLEIGSKRIVDSTGALKLENVPANLLVVGGGYIGLELGSVYAALGSKVTVVELTDGLLPGVDPDLVRPLQARLRNQFAAFWLKTKVVKVEDVKDGVKVSFEGEGPQKEAVFEKVLVAAGRKPNSKDMGFEKAGIEIDAKGFIKTDEQRRTNVPHIFAIGDVAGEPMLAHKASHEAKLAVQVMSGEDIYWDPRCIPAVVFTDPEIAWAGLMENDAKKAGREVKVGTFRWGQSGRATTIGRSDGLTKIVTDPATDLVLGIGFVGPGAGELVGEAVLAIEMGATAKDIALSIHPHPTLTETLSEAAEGLHGLATHLYTPTKKIV